MTYYYSDSIRHHGRASGDLELVRTKHASSVLGRGEHHFHSIPSSSLLRKPVVVPCFYTINSMDDDGEKTTIRRRRNFVHKVHTSTVKYHDGYKRNRVFHSMIRRWLCNDWRNITHPLNCCNISHVHAFNYYMPSDHEMTSTTNIIAQLVTNISQLWQYWTTPVVPYI
jgi:hypothetical protein